MSNRYREIRIRSSVNNDGQMFPSFKIARTETDFGIMQCAKNRFDIIAMTLSQMVELRNAIDDLIAVQPNTISLVPDVYWDVD